MNLTEIIQSKNEGKTLSKLDEMRYNFITQRLDEEVYKGYIVAYHRTKDSKQFMDISNKIGFSTLGKGGGAMYGVGLYGNYTWEGVNTEFSKRNYGDYIVKYIVKPNNVIFFDEITQLKVYGKKMSIIEQCDYWGMTLDEETRVRIEKIDILLSKNKNSYTSDFALSFYNEVLLKSRDAVKSQFYGISYNGRNDRDTILMYDFRNLTILGYYGRRKYYHKKGNHNFYNIDTVSKNTINNTNVDNLVVTKKYKTPEYILDKTKNKIEDINKDIKSEDGIKKPRVVSMSEKIKLFNRTHNIKNDRIGYISDFISTFIGDLNSYQLTPNGVRYYSMSKDCIFDGLQFTTIPFKFWASNSDVYINKCDFVNLSFMFDRINRIFKISDCDNLESLLGIENMQFSENNSQHSNVVQLENLPNLQSLEYLPKTTRKLYLNNVELIDLNPLLNYSDIEFLLINNCPNIYLNKGVPRNVESIIYTNTSDDDVDISLLNKYPYLTYVDINKKIFTRKSAKQNLSR